MKLGILNHYLVNERDEKLLDLHLDQIERHTKVPYTIYATANGLLPQFRVKMERHHGLKFVNVDYPPADWADHILSGTFNKNGDRRWLAHIVILHLDSFPFGLG
jgi:hypothetical protein